MVAVRCRPRKLLPRSSLCEAALAVPVAVAVAVAVVVAVHVAVAAVIVTAIAAVAMKGALQARAVVFVRNSAHLWILLACCNADSWAPCNSHDCALQLGQSREQLRCTVLEKSVHASGKPRTDDDVLRPGLSWIPGADAGERGRAAGIESDHVRPTGDDRRCLADGRKGSSD